MENKMAKQTIREPKQKRAIAKKEKILKASFQIFCDKGYYNTNTAEIAKKANVSTGIVYSYFKDKEDILIEVVKIYIASLRHQFDQLLLSSINQKSLPNIIEKIIDVLISSHTMNVDAHNEFMAMSMLNKDINVMFDAFEKETLEKLTKILIDSGYSDKNIYVKVRIGYNLAEQLAHTYIQEKCNKEDFAAMKRFTIDAIVFLLNDN